MIVADTRPADPLRSNTSPPASTNDNNNLFSMKADEKEDVTLVTNHDNDNNSENGAEEGNGEHKSGHKKKKKHKSSKTKKSSHQEEEQPVEESSSSASGSGTDAEDEDADAAEEDEKVAELISKAKSNPWAQQPQNNDEESSDDDSQAGNRDNESNNKKDKDAGRRFSTGIDPRKPSSKSHHKKSNSSSHSRKSNDSDSVPNSWTSASASASDNPWANSDSSTSKKTSKTGHHKNNKGPLSSSNHKEAIEDAEEFLNNPHQGFDDFPDDDQSISLRTTQTNVTTHTTALPAVAMVETHMAVRVMKGEIHNVLTVMRSSDQFLYISANRFLDELTHEHHPLVGQFQELHACLSDWDLTQSAQQLYKRHKTLEAKRKASLAAGAPQHLVDELQHSLDQEPHKLRTPEAMLYLPPFCTAVSAREINAPVTGACLTALHKFLLYGLVHPSKDAAKGMTLIAEALLNCTFEETSVQNSISGSQQQSQMTRAQKRATMAHLKKQQNAGLDGAMLPADPANKALGRRGSSMGANNGGSSHHSSYHASGYYSPSRVDDEQVVLKLLDLAAMVVQCSFLSHPDDPHHNDGDCLIDADLVVGLLNTCLHVSHIAKSASPLLKSAATDALARIVLQVFCHSPGHPAVLGRRSSAGSTIHKRRSLPRQQVLQKLASLLNPANSDEQVIVSSLTAVNIALETSGGTAGTEHPLTKAEVDILQNDLCKYLLQWSTTTDLHILSLTLRVIFNLFQSIPNQLKVPLEVFLTSVHLRILGSNQQQMAAAAPAAASPEGGEGQASTNPPTPQALMPTLPYAKQNHEEKEVVLESILEFCQEPALMQDIYRNYDCDVACTNLFELIIAALGKQACPNDLTLPAHLLSKSDSNKLEKAGSFRDIKTDHATPSPTQATSSGFFTVHTAPAPITQLNKLAMESLLSIINSIARRVHADKSPFLKDSSVTMNTSKPIFTFSGDESHSVLSTTTGMASETSEEELHNRRQRKAALAQVAEMFNEDFMGSGWLDMAVNMDVLDSADNAKGVAEVLYSAAGLDKAKVGIYLSKGPEPDFPFHTKVRQHFVKMYDFTDMNFAASLRLFLSKFRLPGEAQCIDRFMEAFSTELYQQQGGEMSLFKDSDAVYVLSFSTIMLNTDLHNPTIKEANRMTKEQFIKNNRGINGGDDLPSNYLSELYDQIKEKQIQVQREVGEFMKKQEEDEDFRAAWDSILAKHREVATAFFTSAGDARRNIYRAGMHDREMFNILVKWAMFLLPAVFSKAWDDAVVYKTLRGLKQMVLIADHFDMKDIENEILEFLLTQGRDYVFHCITEDHREGNEGGVGGRQQQSSRSLEASDEEGDETTFEESENESQIPYSLLSSGKQYTELDYLGAAHHRGLLALDTGFLLVRRYARKVVSAWPIFIECLCAMRDAKALPPGLADLDDFADSNGNVLPESPYAQVSLKRLENYYVAKSGGDKKKDRRAMWVSTGLEDENKNKGESGWFTKFFTSKPAMKSSDESAYETNDLDKNPEDRRGVASDKQKEQNVSDNASVASGISNASGLGGMSEGTRAVLSVAEIANVEKIVQMGSTKLPVAEQTIRSLLDVVDDYPYDDDPVAEQHAIFSLELAARALLSNRERAVKIFPVFLSKFESILGRISENSVPSPFVIERIVVTVLRCSIHLYDIEELRPNLRVSLHLLVMSIPRTFIRDIADRMACGLAIILRASFPFFESHNEWTFMSDTLDTLANFSIARVFVFDGIASTVECAMPQHYHDDEQSVDASKAAEDSPQLSREACGALSRILIRFVLGFYQGDFSLSVPASVCLEKLYHQMNALYLEEELAAAAAAGRPLELTEKERKSRIPNKDYWQNVAVALYSVCRSPDPEVSRHGYEVCQRIILRTSLREIPPDKWLAILYLMVNKQPPTAADLSRSNTFVLLGNMMMRVLPYLSKRQRPIDADEESKKNDDLVDGEDLSDLVRQTAVLAGENLRHGRRGRVSPLFEKTLQTVTYLSNHMQTDEWKGDRGFGLWASETLLAELEKVGAAGNSLQNQEAIKEKVDETVEEGDEENDDDEDEAAVDGKKKEEKEEEEESVTEHA